LLLVFISANIELITFTGYAIDLSSPPRCLPFRIPGPALLVGSFAEGHNLCVGVQCIPIAFTVADLEPGYLNLIFLGSDVDFSS
jgi:hypothetical protein